jgi:hypothetical protein
MHRRRRFAPAFGLRVRPQPAEKHDRARGQEYGHDEAPEQSAFDEDLEVLVVEAVVIHGSHDVSINDGRNPREVASACVQKIEVEAAQTTAKPGRDRKLRLIGAQVLARQCEQPFRHRSPRDQLLECGSPRQQAGPPRDSELVPEHSNSRPHRLVGDAPERDHQSGHDRANQHDGQHGSAHWLPVRGASGPGQEHEESGREDQADPDSAASASDDGHDVQNQEPDQHRTRQLRPRRAPRCQSQGKAEYQEFGEEVGISKRRKDAALAFRPHPQVEEVGERIQLQVLQEP